MGRAVSHATGVAAPSPATPSARSKSLRSPFLRLLFFSFPLQHRVFKLKAVKAHRQKGEQEKGITAPEIICADSAHAAIDKACDMLRIKLIKIPVRKSSHAIILNPEKYH